MGGALLGRRRHTVGITRAAGSIALSSVSINLRMDGRDSSSFIERRQVLAHNFGNTTNFQVTSPDAFWSGLSAAQQTNVTANANFMLG